MIENIDPRWLSWFVGFTDGEGYFKSSIDRARKTPYYQTQLVIDLRNDDIEVLEEIQFVLRCGYIYRINYNHDRMKGKLSSDHARLIIGTRIDIRETLIPIFDAYCLKTKKQLDYLLWREIFALTDQLAYKTKIGLELIEALIQKKKLLYKGEIEKEHLGLTYSHLLNLDQQIIRLREEYRDDCCLIGNLAEAGLHKAAT